jgi:hypothetical protein
MLADTSVLSTCTAQALADWSGVSPSTMPLAFASVSPPLIARSPARQLASIVEVMPAATVFGPESWRANPVGPSALSTDVERLLSAIVRFPIVVPVAV